MENSKMIEILQLADKVGVKINSIDCLTGDNFFTLYHDGYSYKKDIAIRKAINNHEEMSLCKDECGYTTAKGSYITIAYH